MVRDSRRKWLILQYCFVPTLYNSQESRYVNLLFMRRVYLLKIACHHIRNFMPYISTCSAWNQIEAFKANIVFGEKCFILTWTKFFPQGFPIQWTVQNCERHFEFSCAGLLVASILVFHLQLEHLPT